MKKKIFCLFLSTALTLSSAMVAFASGSPLQPSTQESTEYNGSPLQPSTQESTEKQTTTEKETTTVKDTTTVKVPENVDTQGVVTEEAAAAIEKDIVVEGAKEGQSIAVKPLTADTKEYQAVEKFIEETVKLKKFATVDLKLVDSADAVVQPSGKIKVTLPVTSMESIKAAKFVVVYRVEDNGTFTRLGASEVKDGKISFETDHFSTYVFAEVDGVDGGAIPKTGDNVSATPFIALALIGVTGAVFFATKKKEVTE